MNRARRILLSATLGALALAGMQPAWAQSKKDLVIGTAAGSNIEVLRRGIQPQLEQKGYKVELVEFSDYVQPNKAPADGALDANYFQHVI
jgi:D-methionine transport system substrate-binding protein